MVTPTTFKLAKVGSLMVLAFGLMLTLIGQQTAQAFGCQGQCIPLMLNGFAAQVNLITAEIASPEGEMAEIGKTVGNMVTAVSGLMEKISVTRSQGIKAQAHIRHNQESQRQALKLKRDINDHFGVIDQSACMQAEAFASGVDDQTPLLEQRVDETLQIIDQTSRSPGFKRSFWEQQIGTPEALADQFIPRFSEKSEALSTELIAALTQSTFLPPPAPDKTSAPSSAYKTLYRTYQIHRAVITDALAAHVAAANLPLSERNQKWLDGVAESANLAADGNSLDALIQALGVSQFGTHRALELSGLSGAELQRTLLMTLAKRQFLNVKNQELMRSLGSFNALRYALNTEEFYTPKLYQSYTALH